MLPLIPSTHIAASYYLLPKNAACYQRTPLLVHFPIQSPRNRVLRKPEKPLQKSELSEYEGVLGVSNELTHQIFRLEHLALDQNYVTLKNLVIKTERRILNVLGFVVHVHHPHKLIYIYMNQLRRKDTLQEDQRNLLQKAWSYMNDGLRTDIFLRYRPETIACACIHLAARTINEPVVLPKNPFPWFELFDASDRDVKAICEVLLQLYTITETPRLNRLASHVEKLYNKISASSVQKVEKASNGSSKRVEDQKAVANEKNRNTSPNNHRSDKKKSSTQRDRSRDRKDRDRDPKRSSSRKDRSPRRSRKYDDSPRSKKSRHSKGYDSSMNGNRR